MPEETFGNRRVVVVQRLLPHYRVAFFEALYRSLAERRIRLDVVYGQHSFGDVPETVRVDRPWARYAANRYLTIGRHELTWQSAMQPARGADLVIMEHAARLLGNYLLWARRLWSGQRIAYWGHGANFQAATRASATERFKQAIANRVDWWFAYTELSRDVVVKAGFPDDRITVVQNSIDDSELRNGVNAASVRKLDDARKRAGIVGSNVVLYCGGMYPDKQLDFLLKACLRLRDKIRDVEVVFIGSGPDQRIVEEACARHTWMHFVGPVYGADRAAFFGISQALLMPGLVGLAIVDSFVCGVPIFTTRTARHSPEIAYLRDGENGVITEPDVDRYAAAIAHYFASPAELSRLRQGCLSSADIYTLENMVKRFVGGVEACLAKDRRRVSL